MREPMRLRDAALLSMREPMRLRDAPLPSMRQPMSLGDTPLPSMRQPLSFRVERAGSLKRRPSLVATRSRAKSAPIASPAIVNDLADDTR
jgi:hypothetical protein